MKIRYITSHGMAEWIDCHEETDEMLTLLFEPYHNGAVVINGKIFTVKNGEAHIQIASLSDGYCSPTLETDHGVYCVEGFTKRGKSISVSKSNESTVRRLISRFYNLEAAATKITEKVERLEKVCHGHNIFDFERIEK